MSGLLSKLDLRRIGRWCGWAAAVLLLFTLLTGYGISEFRTVSRLTFGILDKAAAHRLHHYTDIPLFVFLVMHVGIALWGRLSSRIKARQEM
ncbi:MAG: hypothetical protein SVX38_04590 [Chloroflexota bacterium]|nr:hypothetical protein [Chloroflexota bacterium]